MRIGYAIPNQEMLGGTNNAPFAGHGEVGPADFNHGTAGQARRALQPDRNGSSGSACSDKAPRMDRVKRGSLGKPSRQACDQAGFASMSVNEVCTAPPKQSPDRKNAPGIFERPNRVHQFRNDMRLPSQLPALINEKPVVAASHDRLNAVAERANQVEDMNLCTPALALRH